MLFQYTSDDGEQCLQWCHRGIEKVLNKTTNTVRIVWQMDMKSYSSTINARKWNHKKEKNESMETVFNKMR